MHPTPNWPFALWNLTISYGNPSDIPWMWRQSPWVAAGNSLEFVCECKGTTSRSPKWQLRSLTVIYDHLRSFTGPSSALEPCHADFADLRRSFFQIIWQMSSWKWAFKLLEQIQTFLLSWENKDQVLKKELWELALDILFSKTRFIWKNLPLRIFSALSALSAWEYIFRPFRFFRCLRNKTWN